MAVQIRNPSLELVTLPYPLRGILRGGQGIILTVTYSALVAVCPTITNFLIENLGDDYDGENHDALYAPIFPVAPSTGDTIIWGTTAWGTTPGGGGGGNTSTTVVDFDYASASTISVASIPAGKMLFRAVLEVPDAWNGTAPSALLGTDAEPGLVLAASDSDLTFAAQYESGELHKFLTAATLVLTINAGGSSAGTGRLLFTLTT